MMSSLNQRLTALAAKVGARLKSLVEVTLRRIHWLVGLDLWTNCYGCAACDPQTPLGHHWASRGSTFLPGHGLPGRLPWASCPDARDAHHRPGLLCRYATILVPSLMIGPQYFKGEVDFGTISQASCQGPLPVLYARLPPQRPACALCPPCLSSLLRPSCSSCRSSVVPLLPISCYLILCPPSKTCSFSLHALSSSLPRLPPPYLHLKLLEASLSRLIGFPRSRACPLALDSPRACLPGPLGSDQWMEFRPGISSTACWTRCPLLWITCTPYPASQPRRIDSTTSSRVCGRDPQNPQPFVTPSLSLQCFLGFLFLQVS